MINLQRRHKRLDTLVLLYVSSSETADKHGRAALVNVSRGGAAVETQVKFEEKEKIVLRFTLPNKKIYIINGKICRADAKIGINVYGIQFETPGFIGRFKRAFLVSRLSSYRQK